MAPDLGFDGGLTCALAVRNFDRSAAWYQANLGFELLYKVDEMGWGELKTPVERVLLGLSEVEKVEVKGGPTLTFGVKDIEAAQERRDPAARLARVQGGQDRQGPAVVAEPRQPGRAGEGPRGSQG